MSKPKTQPSPGYQVFMLVLCLYAMGALAVQTVVRLDPRTLVILDRADYAVCALFLVDFGFNLWRAPSARRYFLTWGWLDLLSSIPNVEFMRWGRAARVLRICRVLRGLRATKMISSLVLRRRSESTFFAVTLVAILMMVFSSIAVLHFETAPDSNIKTPGEALWWAFTTMTTVGGDHFPVTTEGRCIAAMLMCTGIGLFGTFSGLLAAWFVESGTAEQQTETNSEIDGLRKEIASLRDILERMEARTISEPKPDESTRYRA